MNGIRCLHPALLAALCGCAHIEAGHVDAAAADTLSQAGAIVYSLPRTVLHASAVLELDLQAPPECGPRAPFVISPSVRDGAVLASARPDPAQVYYLRGHGKSLQSLGLSLTLDETGVLLGSTATREDKVLPFLGEVAKTVVGVAATALTAAGSTSPPRDSGCDADGKRIRDLLDKRAKLIADPKTALAGINVPFGELLRTYESEISRLRRRFQPTTGKMRVPVSCRVDLQDRPAGGRIDLIRIGYASQAQRNRLREWVNPEQGVSCQVSPFADRLGEWLKTPSATTDFCVQLSLELQTEKQPALPPGPSTLANQLVYRVPQNVDWQLRVQVAGNEGAEEQAPFCSRAPASAARALAQGSVPVSQWGRLMGLALTSLNDHYELELHPGSGALKSYRRQMSASDLSGAVRTVNEGAQQILQATDRLARLKREAEILQVEAELRKLREEAEGGEAPAPLPPVTPPAPPSTAAPPVPSTPPAPPTPRN